LPAHTPGNTAPLPWFAFPVPFTCRTQGRRDSFFHLFLLLPAACFYCDYHTTLHPACLPYATPAPARALPLPAPMPFGHLHTVTHNMGFARIQHHTHCAPSATPTLNACLHWCTPSLPPVDSHTRATPPTCPTTTIATATFIPYMAFHCHWRTTATIPASRWVWHCPLCAAATPLAFSVTGIPPQPPALLRFPAGHAFPTPPLPHRALFWHHTRAF